MTVDVETTAHPPKKLQITDKIKEKIKSKADNITDCINIIYVQRNIEREGSNWLITTVVSVCEKPIKFLIDTGAHASMIAAKHIKSKVLYYPKIQYCLVGINGPKNSVRTLGATYGNIIVNGVKLNQQFQIAGDEIHLGYDGILGFDFLHKFGVDLNLLTLKMTFLLPENHDLYEHEERMTFEGANRNIIAKTRKQNIIVYKQSENMATPKANHNKHEIIDMKIDQKVNALQVFRANATESAQLIKIEANDSVDLLTQNESDIVCKENMFATGIYTVNTVIPKGINAIKIFNQTDEPVELNINDLRIDFEKLEKYDVYRIKESKKITGTERTNFILENLQTNHCSENELRMIERLVSEYNDIFYVEGDGMSFANFAEHKISVKPGTNPIFTRQYKLPHAHKEILERKIREMLDNDIIEPSTSLWNSPLLLVPKRDTKDNKDFRVCVDFRKINKVTENQTFPMPDLDEELSKMNGSKVFSTLDIYSAFHQIKLREQDREITAFQTSNKKYQFKRMPFGLKSSPVTWQMYIVASLSELLNEGNMAYMDDIMSYDVSVEKHITNLTAVFDRLRKFNLKLKINKTKLFCKEIRYLGHVINTHGVRADPRNVEAIERFPQPIKLEQVQRFVGMASYYRKYIANFAKIAQPLHALCKKDVKFVWSEGCEKAFQQLKRALISTPVLCFADHSRTFYISVDASFYAVGAYISNEKPPNDRPIEFFSKALNAAQINYATTHKELLAIVLAIERFQHYIWGKHFVVYTDHQALTYLFNQNKPGSRLLRWKLLLAEFDFDIIHRPGKNNVVSDCLSRIENSPDNMAEIRYFHFVKNQITKSILQVATRSRARENALITANEEKPKSDFYHINEEPSLAFNVKKYERIFFIFENTKNMAFKKLELKLKKKIELVNKPIYKIIEINDSISIIMVQKTRFEIEKLERALEQIRNMTIKENLNEIAVNVCVSNYRTYFEIKTQYRQLFRGSETKTTFYVNTQIEITDIEHINEILCTYHKSILGGHRGVERMKNTIQRYYSWPSMTSDIKKYVENCGVCEKTKIFKHTHTPLQITSVANAPFEKIYIDFVGEINPHSAEGHKYLMTISCDLTKYLLAIPTFDSTAIEAAKVIVEEVCITFNIPKIIISDNGPAFISSTFEQMAKLLEIKHIKTAPYHPQSNGAIERYHRTLGQHIRAYTQKQRENWHKYVKYFTFSYNNTIHSATGYSPHALVFGYNIELPTTIKNARPNYNYESYQQELQMQLKESQKRAKEMIEKRKKANKKQYDKANNCKTLKLKRNDLVLLIAEKATAKGKFDEKYRGPFRVEEVISDAITKIRIKNKSKIVHNDKLKRANADYGDNTPPALP